jgi:hypothetical protein
MSFKEYISSKKVQPMELLESIEISDNLKYHLENNISLCENVFRVYSEAYFSLIREVRELYNKDMIAINDEDAELLETDLGEFIELNGEVIYFDAPMLEESEINEAEVAGKKVKLNKPTRTPGGPKKFKVHVKTSSGRIKTVRFGDSKASGLTIKNSNPARARSFRARHKCSEKKDRTTPGYWSCNVGRYAKALGLSSSRPW